MDEEGEEEERGAEDADGEGGRVAVDYYAGAVRAAGVGEVGVDVAGCVGGLGGHFVVGCWFVCCRRFGRRRSFSDARWSCWSWCFLTAWCVMAFLKSGNLRLYTSSNSRRLPFCLHACAYIQMLTTYPSRSLHELWHLSFRIRIRSFPNKFSPQGIWYAVWDSEAKRADQGLSSARMDILGDVRISNYPARKQHYAHGDLGTSERCLRCFS